MPHQRNPHDRSLIATDRRTWSRLRARIIARDRGICQLCGSNAGSEVDHIIERRLGGSDDPANLRLLCQSCHQQRRRRPDAKPTDLLGRLVPVSRGSREPWQPYQFPVHNHSRREDLPMLRGNHRYGVWKGEGCPPGCDIERG